MAWGVFISLTLKFLGIVLQSEILATYNFFLPKGLDIQLPEDFLLWLPISTLMDISPNRSLVNLFLHVHLGGPEITHLDFILTNRDFVLTDSFKLLVDQLHTAGVGL